MQVRAIAATDGDRYRSILERTSEEDRYCRFFHVVDHFTPEFVERYVSERAEMIGFIAEDDSGPLGTAHAVSLDDRTAELAIIVARDARHKGIGRALLARVIDASRAGGCERLIAYALSENAAFARLARSLGMVPDPTTDGSVVTWTLPISRKAALEAGEIGESAEDRARRIVTAARRPSCNSESA